MPACATASDARKTNYDYTGGQLSELIQVIIEEKAAFFVCAVGVPPREVVDALHKGQLMYDTPEHYLNSPCSQYSHHEVSRLWGKFGSLLHVCQYDRPCQARPKGSRCRSRYNLRSRRRRRWSHWQHFKHDLMAIMSGSHQRQIFTLDWQTDPACSGRRHS